MNPNNIFFAGPNHLDQILKLWGDNRGTLGLMPKDAFKDCIRKKWILVFEDESNTLSGYLQFRFTRRTQTVSIVHLCVGKTARGNGVSIKLLDKLVELYKDKANGLKLNCRSDYKSAIELWQKYNFQPKGNLPSRSNDPNIYLTTWWFSFGRDDLFSFITTDKVKAVLDFNIIAKLSDNYFNNIQIPEEVEHLLEDWLIGEVQYYHASETLSEIYRDKNHNRRERSSTFTRRFPELNIDKPSINQAELQLKPILAGISDNDRSDRRQLAEAILSGFPYFITLDSGILRKKAEIENLYPIKICSPSDFISEIDESINASDYYPSKLSGNNFTINKLTSLDKQVIARIFLDNKLQEKKSNFLSKVNKITSTADSTINIIKEKDEIVATIGYYHNLTSLIVPLFRTKQYNLRQTLFMQNLHDLINYAVLIKKDFIIINDTYLNKLEISILKDYGFFDHIDNSYIRGVCNKLINRKTMRADLLHVTNIISNFNELVKNASECSENEEPWNSYYLEKRLWPLKISDSDIPCFIVPIKPHYAQELFDTKAAKQSLFGVNPNLIWNKENVYYRNITPNIEKVPARILWYASQDDNSSRQKAIVCSSYLDEVIIGPAKYLYNKYKKFGVYSWEKHIWPTLNKNENKEIKILRFSDSESFNRPISYLTIKKILKKNNEKDNNFQSPLKISNKTFIEIYSLGKEINNKKDEQINVNID